ncbi:hypothetical protein F2Q69_00051045 [Brassica cretica]|uniref:Uncharacterized protein n=1 Tax=Brassica cretica TaxID=69181 RepID=A0A8S9Q190_BRACR|nr:hypothetical protein F2Q69_00051045 [Brassica cretica]
MLVLRLRAVRRESHVTVRIVGRRSMIWFVNFVEHLKLRPERKQVVKTRMMFSNYPTTSSTLTIKKSSPLSMLGKSCVMTRSGVRCLRLKLMETPKRGSVGMFHSQQAPKQLKQILVTMMKPQLALRVLRPQRPVLRRQWMKGRRCLNFRQCGA